jgi:pimeloyl-ACP methyl ester carboxylesterase
MQQPVRARTSKRGNPRPKWSGGAIAAGGAAAAGVALYLWAGRRERRVEAPHHVGDARRPSWGKLLAEFPAAGRLLLGLLKPPAANDEAIGRGRAVLVIPGFLANDVATGQLRKTLKACGFRPFGWADGMNLGARPDLLEILEERLDQILAEAGGPVSLVGWSLGGLYARELAKRRPKDVSVVVTLGTPFSVDLRDNNAWKLYEAINDHPVDHPPIAIAPREKPPVRTVAIWSKADGIVAQASARGLPGEADERIEVGCRHNELVSDREAVAAVLEVLKA